MTLFQHVDDGGNVFVVKNLYAHVDDDFVIVAVHLEWLDDVRYIRWSSRGVTAGALGWLPPTETRLAIHEWLVRDLGEGPWVPATQVAA